MQKLLIRAKQIVVFFALWAIITWFSAEIIFALFEDKINISEEDLLGSACVAFILVYVAGKPIISHLKLKLWIKYALFVLSYSFLFLLISFM